MLLLQLLCNDVGLRLLARVIRAYDLYRVLRRWTKQLLFQRARWLRPNLRLVAERLLKKLVKALLLGCLLLLLLLLVVLICVAVLLVIVSHFQWG